MFERLKLKYYVKVDKLRLFYDEIGNGYEIDRRNTRIKNYIKIYKMLTKKNICKKEYFKTRIFLFESFINKIHSNLDLLTKNDIYKVENNIKKYKKEFQKSDYKICKLIKEDYNRYLKENELSRTNDDYNENYRKLMLIPLDNSTDMESDWFTLENENNHLDILNFEKIIENGIEPYKTQMSNINLEKLKNLIIKIDDTELLYAQLRTVFIDIEDSFNKIVNEVL